MKKKLLVPIFLAAMALPLALANKPSALNADYISIFSDKSEYLKYGVQVNAQMADEGFVLLKNDGTLPLDEGAMVSVVGKSSRSLALGGGGSGSASTSSGVTEINSIKKSLENAGFEVNPVSDEFYKNASGGRKNGNDNWKGNSQVVIGETPISELEDNDDLLDSFYEYNDAVVQVITREGSEGCDVKTCNAHDSVATNSSNKAVSYKHALELSDNEQALFDLLHDYFDHIIIVINSSNIFECDQFEKDDQVAGVLWIGNPGDVGAGAVGRILSGEVNPSGRTVDTWTRDFTLDPSFQNFSDNSQTNLMKINGEDWYVPQDTMFNADGTPMRSYGTDKSYSNTANPKWDSARGGAEGKVVQGGINGVKPSAYVSYEEGIYVDYRYYETRYADMAIENKAAADEWYNGEEGVVYPFGYGLSYTTFNQKILRVAPAPGEEAFLDEESDIIEVSVRVTNTGNVAGKDVVQLYWKAPYTPGGIEKADHILCAFGKTKVLDPGESQTLQLTFHLQDVANYDFTDANNNDFKGYELDEGTYSILLGKNAHKAYGKVDLKVINGGIQYENDRFTGHKVENRFTDRGFYSSMPGENDIEFTQMSRRDFVETFPTHPTIEDRTVKEGSRFEEFLTHEFSVAELDEGNFEYVPEAAKKTEQDFVDNGWEQNGKYGVKLSEMKGADWDDPKWEQLVNGLSWSDMLKITETNAMSSKGIDGVGKNGFSEGDGPQKMKASNGVFWVSSPIIAATYNQELAHKQGECCGMESLLGGQNGWWGPAVNTHRSPFGGRNFEYYAADPFLMGRMAAEVVGGATDRGVYCYFKHFATNDQEKNRESGISFLTEQALREIYLKSFQMVFEEGRSIGVMGSYNRMGLMETAASYPLLTEVLRGEWGFQGSVLSDMTHSGNGSVNFKCYENVNNRVLAGCNAQLDSGGFSGNSEAKWNSSAWGGKGAPEYTNKQNQKVISWSYWYATRQMAKGHMFMAINCTGQGKNYSVSKGTQAIEAKIGEEISIDVNEYFDGTATSYKVNERRGRNALPEGLELSEAGVISGTLNQAGLHYIDIIAYGAPNQAVAAVQIALTIVPDEADYDEELMEVFKEDEGKGGSKKGCFGDMTAVGTLAGILTLAGLGVVLTSIKKRKEA